MRALLRPVSIPVICVISNKVEPALNAGPLSAAIFGLLIRSAGWGHRWRSHELDRGLESDLLPQIETI